MSALPEGFVPHRSQTRLDNGWTPDPDPERRDYGSFAAFRDPDGNSWVLRERRSERGA